MFRNWLVVYCFYLHWPCAVLCRSKQKLWTTTHIFVHIVIERPLMLFFFETKAVVMLRGSSHVSKLASSSSCLLVTGPLLSYAVQNRSCERRLTSHALCQKRIHPISPLLSTEQDRKLVPILVSCVLLKYDQNFLAKNGCLSISAILQMFTP